MGLSERVRQLRAEQARLEEAQRERAAAENEASREKQVQELKDCAEGIRRLYFEEYAALTIPDLLEEANRELFNGGGKVSLVGRMCVHCMVSGRDGVERATHVLTAQGMWVHHHVERDYLEEDRGIAIVLLPPNSDSGVNRRLYILGDAFYSVARVRPNGSIYVSADELARSVGLDIINTVGEINLYDNDPVFPVLALGQLRTVCGQVILDAPMSQVQDEVKTAVARACLLHEKMLTANKRDKRRRFLGIF